MKELHNHIFSNTTCISKEIMLRYINKQLSKNELYEVEKHMLDCELCSDAYEGMQFAQNSSMLFAIDNQIDQRVGMGNSKAPIMRKLMVAASVIVIIFGAYFTINYFNKTIGNKKGLAINSIKKPQQEKAIEKAKEAEKVFDMDSNSPIAGASKEEAMLLEVVEKKESLKQGDVFKAAVGDASVVADEQTPEVDRVEFLAEEMEEDYDVAENKNDNRTNVKEESNKQLESLSDVRTSNTDNSGANNSTSTNQKEPSTITKNGGNFGYIQANEDKTNLPKKELKKRKDKARKSKGKKRYKSTTPSSSSSQYFLDGGLEKAADFNTEKSKHRTITINSYKVVDYTEEYQKEYDLENTNIINTKSTSADFESKEDAALAEKEEAETIIKITYKETLEKAIKLYKNQKYNEAIAQFDIILKEHPDEVNGWFYGGLSDYHLQRYNNANKKFDKVLSNKVTEFNEEANWYQALTLIELKQTNKAKKLLKEIVNSKGFYKTKAEKKLKTL